MTERSLVHILHVEDDDICLMMLERMIRKAKLPNPVHAAHDGIEALEVLRGSNGRAALPRPFIILLDLNMPRMGGIEFLDVLRQDPDLKTSEVFVMTTSNAESDKVKAFDRGVAGYILKNDLDSAFRAVIGLLKR